MRDWRRANILLKKLETLVRRVRPDGTFAFGLRYFGSSATGRWSGDAGFSMLNLPRGEMFGVNLRALFKTPPGYKFIISDFSSLEPRAGNWVVGNHDMLEMLRDPDVDIYEAHARSSMGYADPRPLKQYDKEEGTEIRKLSKARVLGAGYGASASKFVVIAKTMADLDLDPKEAERVVADFRKQNPKIVNTWRKLDRAMKVRAGRGDFTMGLPSGRVITYSDVSSVGEGLSAVTCRNGKMMRSRWWGSKIFENCVQGTAREILAEKLLQLELEHEILPALHVHDEIVLLVKENEAEEKKALLEKLMSEPPSFMPGLPLAAEAQISDCYTK
jgi:DNA polymerase